LLLACGLINKEVRVAKRTRRNPNSLKMRRRTKRRRNERLREAVSSGA
jgi:hypothetical protein